jgi:hypothetical protein
MTSSKNIDLQRDFAAGVSLSEVQNSMVPWSFVLFIFSVVLLYSIVSFRILNYFCVHTPRDTIPYTIFLENPA